MAPRPKACHHFLSIGVAMEGALSSMASRVPTRVATLRPGDLVRVEVIGELAVPCTHLPTVGERLL